MDTPLCIYHSPCPDGFTAAWIVNKTPVYHEFYPGVYGDPPPDVTGRHVLLVDFSYKRPVLLKMAEQARQIFILDHHKSAEANLVDLPPNVKCVFDMERSGAQIAWDWFFSSPSKLRPLLVNYVGDQDLWKFEMLRSK